MFRVFLLGLAIPAQAVIIPLFLIINHLGLYDTLWGVILPTAAFSMPVSVLVLTGGMRDISASMYEAMALDGARPGRVLVRPGHPAVARRHRHRRASSRRCRPGTASCSR